MNAVVDQPRLSEGLAVEAQTESEFDRLLRMEYSPRSMLEGDNMGKMMRLAEQMANSKLSVPEHLRANIGDCLAIITQAMLWNMNPFAVAQKTHLVSGKLGYEAQLVNAVVMNSGAVRGSPRYEYKGEGNTLECRVGFIERGNTEITWGEWLKNADITTRNSPLWKTNVKQQLGYLQLKNWARAFCPGAILGVYTVDELEQIDAGAAAAPAPSGPRRKSDTQMVERVDSDAVIAGAGETTKQGVPATPTAATTTNAAAPAPAPASAQQGGISGGQVAYIKGKLKNAGISEASICDRFQVSSVDLLNVDQFDELKAELLANS